MVLTNLNYKKYTHNVTYAVYSIASPSKHVNKRDIYLDWIDLPNTCPLYFEIFLDRNAHHRLRRGYIRVLYFNSRVLCSLQSLYIHIHQTSLLQHTEDGIGNFNTIFYNKMLLTLFRLGCSDLEPKPCCK